jgi:hypothetical protein
VDEEQRAWLKQFQGNFGAREYVRFAVVFMFWVFSGVALSIILGFGPIFPIFVVTVLVFAAVAPKWKPAYLLLRKILANNNLPTEPMPRPRTIAPARRREWWSYLPAVWWLLVDLLFLFAVIQFLSK